VPNGNCCYSGSVIEDNVVVDNQRLGGWVEIIYAAVIRRNRVERNGGTTTDGWLGKAGIHVSNSPDRGYVTRCSTTRTGSPACRRRHYVSDFGLGLLSLRNFYVHDNTVRMITGNTRAERRQYGRLHEQQ